MIGSTIDEKPATGAARSTSARKSGAADAKSAPPAWVVSSTGTVARAEAGDVWAMEQIAYGNIGLARSLNLYSLVECLTQRRRETESAEKSQKSERKERYDKKRPENFFHPIGENNYDAN